MVIAKGVLIGFASGAIATGTLKGALKGAFWGAISAGVAYGVAELASTITGVTSDVAHAASLIKGGMSKLTAIKSLLHSLSRGIIAKLQGDSFRAGFFSGLSSALDIGTVGYGTIVGRTVIMAVVGGTASALGGGKFANGAMSGAFVHLFNAEGKTFVDGIKSIRTALMRFGDYLARISGFRDWQEGSVILENYYRDQAIAQTKYTYNIGKFIATNPKARSLAIDSAEHYIKQNPEYVAGRFLTGALLSYGAGGISGGGPIIPTVATIGDITSFTANEIDSFVRGVVYGY